MSVSKSRRRLITALGAVAIFVAACGSSSTSSSNGVSETQNPNAVNGGTLTLGVWQPQSSFLNAGWVDSQTFSYLLDAPVSEGLLWYRSNNSTSSAKSLADYWQPWLATEVPTTDNHDVKTTGCPNAAAKMCVTWKLRSGVQWHDGSTLSSADVCATYDEFWLKYGNNNPTPLLSTTLWNDTLDCKQTDPLTATIDYNTTIGPYLSLGAGVLGIQPVSILKPAMATGQSIERYTPTVDLGAGSGSPVGAYKGSSLTLDQMIDGTGPYVFSSQDANSVVFVKNKNYWNKDHQPHIDKIVFKNEADLPTEVNDAKTGAVDMAFDMRLNNLQGLLSAAGASNPKLKVQTIPDSGAEKVDLNLCANDGVGAKNLCGSTARTSKYTADPVIRKAMLEGINRPNIVQQETAGQTTVPKDSFLYLGAEWIDSPSIPNTAYDAAKANSDLDAAGYKLSPRCDNGQTRAYKDGTCIDINLGTTKSNPARVATESLIAADLQKVGIHVITPFFPNETNGVFFGSFSSGGSLYTHNFDMGMYTNTLSAPAEPDSFYAGYHGDCGGTCAANDQIPSAANQGQGQNDTGISDPILDKALDDARNTVDLTARGAAYLTAEQQLAKDIPEIPLYQQITVDSYSPKLQGLQPNDLVWDFNSYDWFCTGGNCQA